MLKNKVLKVFKVIRVLKDFSFFLEGDKVLKVVAKVHRQLGGRCTFFSIGGLNAGENVKDDDFLRFFSRIYFPVSKSIVNFAAFLNQTIVLLLN